ncbi:hypothetical protein [Clostridium sp.]|uniref:hypothetical protein n=1 Tax=Clostridium sp. TaxID=1506 RepID=UPI003D6CAF59
MKNTKIASILVSASMTILVFSGCSGRTKIPNVVTKQQMSNTIKPNQSNSIAMRELYSKTLKELVTAKTITQTQSSKVLAAITNSMTPNTVAVPDTVTAPDAVTTPNTVTTPNGVKTPNTVRTPNTVMTPNTDTTTTINGMSSLVKSKVITQAQANTINLKIQEAMKNIQTNK